MLIIILLLITFLIVLLIDAPKLIINKHWKDLIVYLLLLSLAFLLTILSYLDVNIPNPLKAVKYLIEDILGLKYNYKGE